MRILSLMLSICLLKPLQLEWCTVSTFSFKDNFYGEQQTKDEIKPIEETKLMEGVQSMTLVGVA
jgi:hypothetical protein